MCMNRLTSNYIPVHKQNKYACNYETCMFFIILFAALNYRKQTELDCLLEKTDTKCRDMVQELLNNKIEPFGWLSVK